MVDSINYENAVSNCAFGKQMRAAHFAHIHSTGVAMLNSGSFGIAPSCVLDRKIQLIYQFESFGDDFVRTHQLQLYKQAVDCVASLTNCNSSDCALVDNATTGVAECMGVVAESYDGKGEVLINSFTYGSVAKMAESYFPDRVRCVQLSLPVSNEQQILQAFQQSLVQHPDVVLVVIDHITSGTACQMPVEKLCLLCKQHNAQVIVDGAHAIGQVADLDIPSVGADFFVGNLHKWMFTPKSAALIWAAPAAAHDGDSRRQRQLRKLQPHVISWTSSDPEIWARHAFVGTRDISSVLAVTAAVQFVQHVCGGLNRIHAYCKSTADAAAQQLAAAWGTDQGEASTLLLLPEELKAPFMRLVRLPDRLQLLEFKIALQEQRLTSRLWRHLLKQQSVNGLFLCIQDTIYVRISASIITDNEDVIQLRDMVLNWQPEDFKSMQ